MSVMDFILAAFSWFFTFFINIYPSRTSIIHGVLVAFGQSNVIITALTVLLVLVICGIYQLRQIYGYTILLERNVESASSGEQSCHRFSFTQILLATEYFNEALVIGKGGFGKVYKGIIHGRPETLAIKRLNPDSKQGANEFWREIETLSKLRHVHLVSLLGYCMERDEMILVYEYMPRGTVADNLYKSGRDGKERIPLTWEQRLKICIGAARGLDYLHTGFKRRIIHRDVKVTNILLDENLVAKISDFGLSKLSETQDDVSTKVKGTVGYMDPDYIKTHKPSTKSDVYAFGIVMLVALSGRPAVERRFFEKMKFLLDCYRKCVTKGEMSEIIDPCLKGEILTKSLTCFMETVEKCLHRRPKKRPSMAQIVLHLENALEEQIGAIPSTIGEDTVVGQSFPDRSNQSFEFRFTRKAEESISSLPGEGNNTSNDTQEADQHHTQMLKDHDRRIQKVDQYHTRMIMEQDHRIQEADQHHTQMFKEHDRRILEADQHHTRMLKEHDQRIRRTIKDSVERWLAYAGQMIQNKGNLCTTWIARYKLSKVAFKKTSHVTDLQSRRQQTDDVAVLLPPLDINFLPDSTTMADATGGSIASTSMVVHKKTVDYIISQLTGDVKEIVKQQKYAVEKIFNALQDDDCDIISIYGMGGIGKTTLAKEIGRMAKECGLFDEVVMAVVSQNQDLRRNQGEIGDLLGLKFGEETVKGRAGRLYQRLNAQKRTLVILDDVWSYIDLTSMGIPIENKGCKILMATRRKNMCSNMMFDKGQDIPVELLTMEASLALLKRNAKPMDDSWTKSRLDDVSKEVVRECRGLPSAIVTVGRALRGKTVEEWKAALQQLKKSKPLNVNDEDKDVFSCLKLSFDYLKSKEALKKSKPLNVIDEDKDVFSCLQLSFDYLESKEAKDCFLLASLFPKDLDIDVEDIVRYGTGIGLFKDVDSVEEARTQTQWITRNLVDACLLMDSGYEDHVKMHDVVRDFAIFISTERFLVSSGLELMEFPNKETFEKYKIISLMRNRIKALPTGLICPNLEMLLLCENEDFEVIPDAFFKGMTRLRVLDLSKREQSSRSSTDTPELLSRLTLPSSMADLEALHTLYLNHCMLDDMSILGKLKRLEILSLYLSHIKTLPKEMGELTNLRLLDLSLCRKLKHIPANLLSRLTRLEELYMLGSFVDWGVADSENQETGMACLSELTSLHRLTNLSIQVPNPESFPQNFHVPNLQKFYIAIGSNYFSLGNYPSSKILLLKKIERSLPQGVMDMIQTREELELNLSTLRDEVVKSIIDVDQGGLSRLKSLTVKDCKETVFMMDVPARDAPALLSNLELLHLMLLVNMEDICRSSLPEGSLHKLKTLGVTNCNKLDPIVTGLMLLRLLSLEEIEVSQCGKATHIFGHIGTDITGIETRLLSNLRRIELSTLYELQEIWIGLNPESPAISLDKLTEVSIFNCTKLSYIFPACVAESLVLLQVITLHGCSNLKSIVAKGTQGNQPVYFSNLREIVVNKCTSLKSLFSVAEARNLRHLETIMVWYSDNLTELISHDDTEGGGEIMIRLPKLSTLHMVDLPNMSRLCAKSFTVDLPSLEDLVIEQCPLMESNGVDLTKLGLEDLPMLKRALIGKQEFSGEAIKNLVFSSGKQNTSNKEGKKPLLRSG